jgi:hypothetical protein
MTKFAEHRAAWESFIDCTNAGAGKDAIARLLASRHRSKPASSASHAGAPAAACPKMGPSLSRSVVIEGCAVSGSSLAGCG